MNILNAIENKAAQQIGAVGSTPTSNSTSTTSTSSTSTSSADSNSMDQLTNESTFLQLLVSQIQNQDPLNPTDSIQFVGQLVSFSQLEQLLGINQGVQSLVSDATSSTSSTNTSTSNANALTSITNPTTSGNGNRNNSI